MENSSARGKYCPVRECGASGRTAGSNLRIKEKFHEYVRPGAGQEESYRNRAEPLNVVEPELSNFTFELLCFTPVAASAGSASANPPSCMRGKNRIRELMSQDTDKEISD